MAQQGSHPAVARLKAFGALARRVFQLTLAKIIIRYSLRDVAKSMFKGQRA